MTNRPSAMTSAKPLENVLAIDLKRHAIIEASAGTGKTWTLKELVSRLVSPPEARKLSEILVVTFTEKAAGEMRERIRGAFEEIAAGKSRAYQTPELITAFTQYLSDFDELTVTTIHGFCQGLLGDYPIETRLSFEQELVEDRGLYARMLKRIYRESWLARPAGDLLAILLGFESNPQAWENLIVNLAGKTSFESLDSSEQGLEELLALAESIIAGLPEVLNLLAPDRDGILELVSIKDLPGYNKRSYPSIHEDWQAIAGLLEKENPESRDFARLVNQIFSKKKKGRRYEFDHLTCEKILNSSSPPAPGKSWPEVVSQLDQVVARLNQLGRAYLRFQQRSYPVIVGEVRRLAREEKRFQGLYSYDDMISLVAEALDSPQSQLLARVRERYRVALIDEFQDTDRVQWEVFKKIFTESSDKQVFVIGDPKQAIYGFRGGDLATWTRACEYLESEKNAQRFTLATNWRSVPPLVEAFNQIFATDGPDDGWFSDSPGSVASPGYQASLPTKHPQNLWQAKPLPPVVLKPLAKKEKVGDERYQIARWIADEIALITREDFPRVKLSGDQDARRLGYGDIAILVRSRTESRSVMRVLRQRKIPFTFYKSGGLWSSPEALDLTVLFEALAKPNEASLGLASLTPFFSVERQELLGETGLRRKFEFWRSLGKKRDWPGLFNQLARASGVIRRIFEASEQQNLADALDQRDKDRRLANLKQLLTGLLLSPEALELGLEDLALQLRLRYQTGASLAEDEDLEPLESDGGKVKLMTIHAAKGLEFPLVFLAGGFSEYRASDPYFEFYLAGGQKSFDPLKLDENSELALGYWQSENQRIYYVALTRAIFRLYLPFYVTEDSKANASPLRGKLFRRLRQSLEQEIFILREDGTPGPSPGGQASQEPGLERNEVRPAAKRFKHPLPTPDRFVQTLTDSFSSLAQRLDPEFQSAEEFGLKLDDDSDPGGELSPELEGLICLPRGVETGTAVHEILERLDFTRPAGLGELVGEIVRLYRLRAHRAWIERLSPELPAEPDWEELRTRAAEAWLEHTVENLLKSELDLDQGGIRLDQLAQSETLREVRFTESNPFLERAELAPFLTGSIDLIFRYAGRYYLLDWKTNWLESYTRDSLWSEMRKHRYQVQAAIYAEAVKRWLVSRRLAPELFGGALYVFIRSFAEGSYFEGLSKAGRGSLFLSAGELAVIAREHQFDGRGD